MQPHLPSTGPQRRSEAGFSLLELLLGLAVMAEVMAIALLLFDVNTRVARVQGQITDMQQALRGAQNDVVRMVRMAGRGSLPQAIAVVSRQAVPEDSEIGSGTHAPTIVAGTDVLTVRGVFSSPIYQIDSAAASTFELDGARQSGRLVIDSLSPSRIPQPVEALEDSVDSSGAARPEALILVSSLDDAIYAVVEMTGLTVQELDLDGDGAKNDKRATVDFSYNPGRGAHVAEYLALSPGGVFPDTLTEVAFVGILEEYHYYIREDFAIPDDEDSGLTPKLSRARLYPNTGAVYAGDSSHASVDIADNVIDLQIAFGLDRDGNGRIDPSPDGEGVDDDWLYNHDGDDDKEPVWDSFELGGTTGFRKRLFYVEISTLARTDRPDRRYLSPPIVDIENRTYGERASPRDEAERERRMFRRRLLQTVVDMRNVG